ncbi:putative disease resistance protein At3g14460 [Cornus florida]|uniref:putative disease resistance protein At3g14460 n=1 Tax=Cornus florida TaxID=4283 RepID=UPI0028A08150|nr:putative disease resistance protein At3g14460 [Cornus florida]
MGGMGKTTLAQLVYNDAEVNEKFHMKAWVCVSDAFDSYTITKKIFDDVTASNNNIDSLDQLQIKLKDSLAGKKFLIVLDDVWNHNYNDWDRLRKPFSAGVQDSRIIVTTRSEEVASVMGTIPSHHLQQLPFQDCWSLFVKHAFVNGDYMANPELEKIGIDIVKKCGGLPLAIKSLGGLLRSNLDIDIDYWKYILKSEIWDLKSDISPALRLSYHYLPSHLKRCFVSCSKFPKGYEFEKEKLVQLWIAEDLVQKSKSNTLVEDEGNNYFRELLSRSFFQRTSDSNSYFVMHDLILDLAQHISGKFSVRLNDDEPLDHICEKFRYFSFVQGIYDTFEKFKVVNEVKCLRTFISFSRVGWRHYLGNKVLHDMLSSLRCLRVLSLSRYEISELPKSIESLILLRYLDLSGTKIRRLTDSITTLCNLQTLDLSNCYRLIELPVNIGKLINLHHLDVRGTAITEMPTQMNRLKGLQHLTYFVVGKNSGSRINGLKELCHLRGELCISGLQNVTGSLDASEANLKGKVHLEGLKLEWCGDTDDSRKEREIFDKLQPHEMVKDLEIINYGGTRFPNWLESTPFCKMVSLKLSKCAYCNSLPSIGQLPSLKFLSIEEMKAIVEVGREFYGNASSSTKPFRSLESLSFERMPEWENWHSLGVGEFSCLLELSLLSCPKLTGELPNHIPSLRKIEISGCNRLVSNQIGQMLQHTPSLEELKISYMSYLTVLPTQLQDLNSLQELEIIWIPKLKEFPFQLCKLLKLELLKIEECDKFVSIPGVGLPPTGGLPATLKTLDIRDCYSLEFPILSEEETERNYHLTCSIETLCIFYNCGLLKLLSLGFFPKLRSLEIWGGEDILFPNELQNLIDLVLHDCNAVGRLSAPNLTYFEVRNCSYLQLLPQQMHSLLPSLQNMVISHCPEVESFPNGGLPSNLRELTICNCNKLMEGRMGWGLQALPSLESLCISEEKDEDDDNNEEEEVVVLESFLEWLEEEEEEEEVLESLWEEWLLEEEEELESFPEEWLLPTTLSYLRIANFPNLKSLNHKGLQHLTSLTSLIIVNCPKLHSLPEEGLPNTLTYLCIFQCPLLKPRCQREKGEDWPNIFRIPHIIIDSEDIVNFD